MSVVRNFVPLPKPLLLSLVISLISCSLDLGFRPASDRIRIQVRRCMPLFPVNPSVRPSICPRCEYDRGRVSGKVDCRSPRQCVELTGMFECQQVRTWEGLGTRGTQRWTRFHYFLLIDRANDNFYVCHYEGFFFSIALHT